jgi:hypothetical protein
MRVIDLQYLPQPAYFALLLSYDDLYIDKHEHFVKQTYRNRATVLGPNGINSLSVPVKSAGKKIPVRDVKIDHSQKWVNQHWRTIQAAYGRAPYFEYYADDFLDIYHKKHSYLFDLNEELLTQCLDFLQFDISPKTTTGYIDLSNEEINDFRSLISPKSKKPLPITYNQKSYPQVFGNKFAKELSIIDLIFCEGPQAGTLIAESMEIEQNRT